MALFLQNILLFMFSGDNWSLYEQYMVKSMCNFVYRTHDLCKYKFYFEAWKPTSIISALKNRKSKLLNLNYVNLDVVLKQYL